jgi:hypothetical protein
MNRASRNVIAVITITLLLACSPPPAGVNDTGDSTHTNTTMNMTNTTTANTTANQTPVNLSDMDDVEDDLDDFNW